MYASDALAADTMISRYARIRQHLRDCPEESIDLARALKKLRQEWAAYNGLDDLPELATCETEAE